MAFAGRAPSWLTVACELALAGVDVAVLGRPAGQDAMLGRVLYEERAAYWPEQAEQPIADEAGLVHCSLNG